MYNKQKSYAFHTDHYELTMLDALVQSNQIEKKSVFEVFARELPLGRSFGVFAGSNRVLSHLERFYFNDDMMRFISDQDIVSKKTQQYLSSFRFTGDITSYHEGETYFPNSPVMTIEAKLGEALLIETLLLSIVNFDSAIATAAVRVVLAAEGRFVMEAGSRRIDPDAAVNAARAAYIGGVDVTSNLEAGRIWGIPTSGTASHAFTLSFQTELEAFEAQSQYLGVDSIFLVDTYDIDSGIRNAVRASNSRLKGIRIDSGNLGVAAKEARVLLDKLGAPHAQIMVSGDLDEYKIKNLLHAPIDAFESGHKLVTGSGAASAGFVYKLVAVEDDYSNNAMRTVQKKSKGKISRGGKKIAKRKVDYDGTAIEESIFTDGIPKESLPSNGYRNLQNQIMHLGQSLDIPNVEDSRNHLMKIRSEIPETIQLRIGDQPAIPSIIYPKENIND